MKTTSQIAADCGIDTPDAIILDHVLCETYGDSATDQRLQDIIGALYRRIEALEEIAYQHDTLKRDFNLKCFALEESHKQTDEANRRIEKLEEQLEAYRDQLEAEVNGGDV